MYNPYDPPRRHKKPRVPKHKDSLVDWRGLVIVLGLPLGIITMVIILMLTSAILKS